MIFGLSVSEKYERKVERFFNECRLFAWIPVKLTSGRMIWLNYYYKKYTNFEDRTDAYRFPLILFSDKVRFNRYIKKNEKSTTYGKTHYEKHEIEQNLPNHLFIERKCFAWFPIRLIDSRWVWLCYYYKKRIRNTMNRIDILFPEIYLGKALYRNYLKEKQ